MNAHPGEITAAAPTSRTMDARTQRLLHGPILPTLLMMAVPNLVVMIAQAATGLIETWFIAKLGTDALAGMALVFPGVMLMQMVSGGAMGGGISSAIARTLGAGRRDDADALVMHALFINGALGLFFTVTMLVFGRDIYRLLGGVGAELDAALAYSNVVFAGNILLWLTNALASVIRGTGNMMVPAMVTGFGVFLLIPLSPVLIFGFGPIPALGVAGGGIAFTLYYACALAILAWYVMSGRNAARFRWTPLRWPMLKNILSVGAIASITSLQTNIIIALATALAASTAGAAAAAGYGTGARLEYLLIPIAFGLGAPLVAMVGANIGAGQKERALRIAYIGGAISFIAAEIVGVSAAIWPEVWMRQFSAEPAVIETGAAYLRIAGPAYGFFGLAMGLYFASQGAGRLNWPLTAGFIRLAVAVAGGWIGLIVTGSLTWLFVAIALGLFVHGVTLLTAIRLGAWFKPPARS